MIVSLSKIFVFVFVFVKIYHAMYTINIPLANLKCKENIATRVIKYDMVIALMIV